MLAVLFFFLMIRRPPRSTPLSLHDALPIWDNRLILPKSSYRRQGLAPRCRLITSWGWRRSQGSGCSPVKVVRELGSERRETVRSLSTVGAGELRGSDLSTRGPGLTNRWCSSCRVNGSAG